MCTGTKRSAPSTAYICDWSWCLSRYTRLSWPKWCCLSLGANVVHSYVVNLHNNALACWTWMCRPSQHYQVSFKLIFCVLWENRSGSVPLGSITSVTACFGPNCTAFLLEHSVLCWHLSTILVSFQYYLFYINYYLSLVCISGQHGGSFEWGHSVSWMCFCGAEPFCVLSLLVL